MFPPDRILLGPGPSDVHPAVLRALSAPLLGHLDPDFVPVLDEIGEQLRAVFRTSNRVAFPVSGTGSAGMEAVMVNLVEPGERVVVGVNGVFGGRMAEVARRAGAQVHTVEAPWGSIIDPEAFIAAVREHRPRVAGIVHAETSTGALQPAAEIGAALAATDTLFVLDCVTSLAGVDVDVDGWHVDAAYSGTQKCLSVPPGLAPVTFSDRAVERIRSRSVPVQSWYLDVTLLLGYLDAEGGRTYHHTAPISMLYALKTGLDLVLAEGLETRIARHERLGAMLHEGLEGLGLTLLAEAGHRLPQLSTVALPDGVDEAKWRARLLEDHGIEVGGGLGAFAGRAWRIGLMGHSCQERNVYLLLNALERLLAEA
jgi:alanine-glyoxylate transaminase / serine-glyoxylate transaminase / serine-pyruvate transaminase